MADRVTYLPNRRERRAHAAVRRRDERKELEHDCAVTRASIAGGVTRQVEVTVPFFHDVHRVLGEPRCPRCPRCLGLMRAGRIDRAPEDPAATLNKWQRLLEDERQRAVST